MELRQIRTFAAIAKHGSFVQAAEVLGYAQSTITSHIQALENELGTRLFERLGHRVSLTAQGKSLLPYAEQMCRLAFEAANVVPDPAIPHGRLTIGTNESLGTYILPGMLQAYRQTYPAVEIILKFANCGTICEYIRDNTIDAAIIINEKTEHSDIVSEIISCEQMLFLTGQDHPLTGKARVAPGDLAETCVILTEPGCSYRSTLETIFREAGTPPQSIIEASSIETIKQLIILGLGTSMLPRFTVEKELADGRIHAARWAGPVPAFAIQLLYHKDKWLSPALEAFFQVVRYR